MKYIFKKFFTILVKISGNLNLNNSFNDDNMYIHKKNSPKKLTDIQVGYITSVNAH